MNQNNNSELITKKDYEILGVKEGSAVHEIKLAHQKLCLEYHPAIIRKKEGREPNEQELDKFQEIEKVYKKFGFEPEMYVCCGVKEGVKFCLNTFYPALWIKEEEGKKKYFCSQECYNSKWKSDSLVEKWEKEDKEALELSLTKMKFELSEKLEKARKKAGLEIKDLEPQNRNFFAEIHDVNLKEDANLRDNKIKVGDKLIDEIYVIYNRVEEDIESKSKSKREKESKENCDNCRQEIKKQRVSRNNEGNHYTFCSEECSEKGMKGKGKWVVRKNAFAEFLKWMEKEGITNIRLDPNSGKLVVEYRKNNSKVIEDNNLTQQQKEIKEFFQQTGKNQISQNQVREEVEGKGKNDDNKWLGPVVGVGIIALVIVFIGVIIYRNKKKNY